MKRYEAKLKGCVGTDQQLINAVHQIIKRSGYQPGCCLVVGQGKTNWDILVDIYNHPRLDPMQDDIIMTWGGIELELIGPYTENNHETHLH